MQKVEVTMTFEKETKRTFVYVEDGDNPIIGSTYLQKSAVGDNRPDVIKVTVQAATDKK